MTDTNSKAIKLSPEERKMLMTNLYTNQATIERLVTMKMDIHILTSSIDTLTSEQKDKLKKLTGLWNLVVDEELDTILRKSLSLPKPTITPQTEGEPYITYGNYVKDKTDMWSNFVNSTQLYVLSEKGNRQPQTETTESGEVIHMPTNKYIPITDMQIWGTYTVVNVNDERISLSQNGSRYNLKIYKYTSYFSFILECPECSTEFTLDSQFAYLFPDSKYHPDSTRFYKIDDIKALLPIKCSNKECKALLLIEKKHKPKQTTRLAQVRTDTFFNVIEQQLTETTS